jgi:hypothetical protein
VVDRQGQEKRRSIKMQDVAPHTPERFNVEAVCQSITPWSGEFAKTHSCELFEPSPKEVYTGVFGRLASKVVFLTILCTLAQRLIRRKARRHLPSVVSKI